MTGALRTRRFRVPLIEPFSNARSTWNYREGLLVHLGVDSPPDTGLGEASPLPGFSQESLEQCEHYLKQLTSHRLQIVLAARSPGALEEALVQVLELAPPAARFAVETAAFDRLGKIQNKPVWALLRGLVSRLPNQPTVTSLPVAAVISAGDCEVAVRCAEALHRQGIRTFKIKVGPGTVTNPQLATLQALRKRFGKTVQLRVDANQSLNPQHWPETHRQLQAMAIQMLEEPWPWAHPQWPQEPHFKLALDESLHGLSASATQALLSASSPQLVVLKPTALGGLLICNSLARVAQSRGQSVIVSHTLETSVGWASCAHLALALEENSQAAGLWPMEHQKVSGETMLTNGCLQASEQPGLGSVESEFSSALELE